MSLSKSVAAMIAAILTTLAEVSDAAPESSVYLALGMDMDQYTTIRDVMVRLNLITVKSYTLRLTPLGRQTADKINQTLASAKK